MITAKDRKRICELIDRIYTNENDMAAFGELCRIFTPVIHSNSKQYCKWITYMDKDDFLQEAYMVIWRIARKNPSTYYNPERVDGYFIRSIQNCFINIFRKYVMNNIVIRNSMEVLYDTNLSCGRESLIEYRERIIARDKERREKRRQWLLEHPEDAQRIRDRNNKKSKEKRRLEKEQNPELLKQKDRERYYKDREKRLLYQREYYSRSKEKNPELVKQKRRERYLREKEKANLKRAKKANNPEEQNENEEIL